MNTGVGVRGPWPTPEFTQVKELSKKLPLSGLVRVSKRPPVGRRFKALVDGLMAHSRTLVLWHTPGALDGESGWWPWGRV